jgi:serine/threonine protein kinase
MPVDGVERSRIFRLVTDDLPADLRAALSERYELRRTLGRGGMASVYLAHDRKHQREVAIKVLLPFSGRFPRHRPFSQ